MKKNQMVSVNFDVENQNCGTFKFQPSKPKRTKGLESFYARQVSSLNTAKLSSKLEGGHARVQVVEYQNGVYKIREFFA